MEKKKGKGEEAEIQVKYDEIFNAIPDEVLDTYRAKTGTDWVEIIPMEELTHRMFEIHEGDDEEEEKTEEQLAKEEEERKIKEEEARIKTEEEAALE